MCLSAVSVSPVQLRRVAGDHGGGTGQSEDRIPPHTGQSGQVQRNPVRILHTRHGHEYVWVSGL